MAESFDILGELTTNQQLSSFNLTVSSIIGNTSCTKMLVYLEDNNYYFLNDGYAYSGNAAFFYSYNKTTGPYFQRSIPYTYNNVSEIKLSQAGIVLNSGTLKYNGETIKGNGQTLLVGSYSDVLQLSSDIDITVYYTD